MIDKKILAVIPARGGSKRLPRKNILNFAGKPLLAWTIDAALNSRYLSRVIVSTDDIEIANVAKHNGAEVPFLRTKTLSSDKATTVEVVLDLLEQIPETYTHVGVFQPTSPLRNSQHINESIEQLSDANGIVSVTKVDHPVEWSNTLQTGNRIDGFIKEELKNKRSQDLPVRYRLNGAIYVCKCEVLRKDHSLLPSHKALAYIMGPECSIDIDEEQDFVQALINKLGVKRVMKKVAEI